MISLVFAIMMAVGKSMRGAGSLILMYQDWVQIIKTVILIAGYYIFYLHVSVIVYCGVHSKNKKMMQYGEKFFAKEFFKRPFIVLSIVWMPQVLLKYPGALCYDAFQQLYQFFGEMKFTSHHPPFDTVLIGGFVKFGDMIGSMNVGLFLYILVQTICFIAVLSYTFPLLERLKVSYLYRSIALVIYCVVPYYVGYAGVVIKDTLYGITMIWYFTCITYLLLEKWDYTCNYKNVIRFIIASTLVSLTRNNGIYVVAPMALAISVYFGKVFWKQKKKVILLVTMLFVPVLLYSGINRALNSHYDIQPGSKREMLSIPFQQTARYIKEYGDEVTSEEREAIDAVLAYDKLAEKYDPNISDPVKATFKDECTSEQMKLYFQVWAKQLMKHPLVYVEATLNNIYGMFCPNEDNYVYYANAVEAGKKESKVQFSTAPVLLKMQDVLVTLYKGIHELPIVGVFSNIGFYMLSFFYLLAFMLKDKKYELLFLGIPGLMSIAIAVASPVFFGHPRYLFPLVYTMPLFFAVYTSKEWSKQQ